MGFALQTDEKKQIKLRIYLLKDFFLVTFFLIGTIEAFFFILCLPCLQRWLLLTVAEFGVAAQRHSVYTSPKRKLWLTSFSDTLQRLSARFSRDNDAVFGAKFPQIFLFL